MFLLVTLYSFQGLPLGFILSTVPILFKKYLTYSEIGVIMMCTMPFSFKVLWSPFVEFYHIERIGKRKGQRPHADVIGDVALEFRRRQPEVSIGARNRIARMIAQDQQAAVRIAGNLLDRGGIRVRRGGKTRRTQSPKISEGLA